MFVIIILLNEYTDSLLFWLLMHLAGGRSSPCKEKNILFFN